MIVAKLYVCRTCIGPCEAQSVLVVDADAVLPRTIGAQWFQTVGRRNAQASSRTAASSMASFRIATRWISWNLRMRLPMNKLLVVMHRNDTMDMTASYNDDTTA